VLFYSTAPEVNSTNMLPYTNCLCISSGSQQIPCKRSLAFWCFTPVLMKWKKDPSEENQGLGEIKN
jgi:hypothetical protein